MATKNNIRSIRFSDDLADLIDRQIGNSFTEKFENLITRCVWDLPGKKAELDQLEKNIQQERKRLQALSVQRRNLEQNLDALENSMKNALSSTMKIIQSLEKM